MIYADHAATTPLCEQAFDAMLPYLKGNFANPSSQYKIGLSAKQAINKARKNIAESLGCMANEIYFTSGGSESNSWAIWNLVLKSNLKQILTTPIEHHSILNAFNSMKTLGVGAKYLKIDNTGLVDLNSLESQIKRASAVSIQYANNEVGTIQQIQEISDICRKNDVLFHSDAVQAVGHIKIDINSVDMLSASAHKFGGPKGIGFLYVKNGIKLKPLIYGGGQEFSYRGGTESVANIVGMAVALEKSINEMHEYQTKMQNIENEFYKTLACQLPDVIFNGNKKSKISSIVSVTIPNYLAEKLVYKMDMQDICISAGSACDQNASGKVNPSHVLTSMGITYDKAICTVRFSFGVTNNIGDGEKVANQLIKIIKG